jgi:hypothetical protein
MAWVALISSGMTFQNPLYIEYSKTKQNKNKTKHTNHYIAHKN